MSFCVLCVGNGTNSFTLRSYCGTKKHNQTGSSSGTKVVLSEIVVVFKLTAEQKI